MLFDDTADTAGKLCLGQFFLGLHKLQVSEHILPEPSVTKTASSLRFVAIACILFCEC